MRQLFPPPESLGTPGATGRDLDGLDSGRLAELYAAGFIVDAMWEAPEGEFLLTLATPYC